MNQENNIILKTGALRNMRPNIPGTNTEHEIDFHLALSGGRYWRTLTVTSVSPSPILIERSDLIKELSFTLISTTSLRWTAAGSGHIDVSAGDVAFPVTFAIHAHSNNPFGPDKDGTGMLRNLRLGTGSVALGPLSLAGQKMDPVTGTAVLVGAVRITETDGDDGDLFNIASSLRLEGRFLPG